MTSPIPTPDTDPTAGLKTADRIVITCGKCGGSGRLQTLVDASRCWPCNGTGQVSILVSSYRARAGADAKKATAEQDRRDNFDEQHQAAIAALVGAGLDNLEDLIHRSGNPIVSHLAQDTLFLVRDSGWTAIDATAEFRLRWDEKFHPKPRDGRRNRRPGICQECSTKVPKNSGWLFSLMVPGVGDTWHLLCERCAAPHLPA